MIKRLTVIHPLIIPPRTPADSWQVEFRDMRGQTFRVNMNPPSESQVMKWGLKSLQSKEVRDSKTAECSIKHCTLCTSG
jgi:hypothetical protein